MALVFVLVVPAHFVASLLGFKDLVPPVFLGLIGRVAGLRVRTVGQPLPGEREDVEPALVVGEVERAGQRLADRAHPQAGDAAHQAKEYRRNEVFEA